MSTGSGVAKDADRPLVAASPRGGARPLQYRAPQAQRWREFRLRIHVDDVAESADVVTLFGDFFHATQTEWGSNARLEEFTVEFVDLLGDVLSPYESDQFYELGFHDVLYTFRDSNNRALYDRPTSMEFEDALDEIVLRRLPPRVGLRLAVLWGAPFYSIQNLLLSGYESGTNLGVNEAGAHSDPLAYYVARSSGSLTARVEVLELLMTKGMSLNVLSLRTHRSALSELIAGGGVGSGDAGKLVFAKSLVNHGASASGGSPSPLLTTCGAGLDRGDFSNYRREPPNGHTAHLIFYLLTRGGASPFARFDSSTAAEYLRLWQKDAQLTLNANTSNLISAYKMYGTPMTSGMRYYQESIDKYKRALHGMDAMMKVLLCALDDVHRTGAFPADPRDDTYDRWLRGKGRAT